MDFISVLGGFAAERMEVILYFTAGVLFAFTLKLLWKTALLLIKFGSVCAVIIFFAYLTVPEQSVRRYTEVQEAGRILSDAVERAISKFQEEGKAALIEQSKLALRTDEQDG